MSVELLQRLSFRLTRNAVIVALLLGFLGGLIQVFLDGRTHLKALDDQLAEIALVSSNSAHRAVYLLDNVLAEEVVRGLRNYGFLQQVRILDDRDNLMAAHSTDLRITRMSIVSEWLLGGLTTLYQYDLTNPDSGRVEGYLELLLDNNVAMQPFYNRALYIFASGLLSNILLALILLALFNSLLTFPLISIAQQINTRSGQAIQLRKVGHIRGHTKDELGYIVDATNHFIDQVQQSQSSLRASEHQLRVVVDASPNLLFVVNRQGNILFANLRLAEFYATSIDQLIGKNYLILHQAINASEAERFSSELEQVITRREPVSHDSTTLTDAYKVQRIFQSSSIPFQFSDEVCVLVIAGDITDRVAAEAHVEHLAYFDSLTGLPNRNLILERLEKDLVQANRSGSFGALLFIDIDDFKRINDTLGHSVGDRVLIAVTNQLKESLVATDTLARLGGDEFMVSLPDLSTDFNEAENRAANLADLINRNIGAPIRVDKNEFRLTASIGVVIFSGTNESVEDVLRYADTAMYRAKHQGKHRYELFRPAMAMEATRLVTLEQELRTAITESQFEVYLQPIVNQRDSSLLSAEALLRWRHPTQGILAPAHFMAFLENSDMINEVGQFVLETVCKYLANCLDTRMLPDALRISINVCARELYQQDFPERVQAMLEKYQLTGSHIELEVTESVALQSVAEAIATMDQLISLGLTFALDDFGTGYSSLSYLKQLPVQTVKIDKTFIRGVTQDRQDAAMVASILAIANTLGLKTVAEGIEFQDQATWLSQYEHISLQGYLFGRPLPISEFHDRWVNR